MGRIPPSTSFLIVVSLVFLLVGYDGRATRIEGVALAAGIVAYTTFTYFMARREGAAVKAEYAESVTPAYSVVWEGEWQLP